MVIFTHYSQLNFIVKCGAKFSENLCIMKSIVKCVTVI